MKKVVMYGRHSKKPLFIGTETECRKWIFSLASDHIKLANGNLLIRELHDPDGIAYDVGQAVMYQIIDATTADGTLGMCQYEADGNK